MDVKEENIININPLKHWYYISKGKALIDLLKNQKILEILDIGAGSGIFSKILLDNGVGNSSTCVDPAYKFDSDMVYNSYPIRFRREINDCSHDFVLMMDVIEHVEDDIGFIREYSEKLAPNGRILISVPAFQFLWSGHDVFLEHHRRYTLGDLERVVESAGLRVVRSRFFFGSLFPLVALMRVIGRCRMKNTPDSPKSELKAHSKFINRSLIFIHNLERYWLFPFNKWFGLTIFCLAEKV